MAGSPSGDELRRARVTRRVAVVVVATPLLWLALQWLGGQMGWPPGLVFVFDLGALAAFLWAIVVTVGLWRARKDG